MDTKDWKTICYLIDTHKQNNTKEGAYQKTIENIFDVLGWNKNEICPQFPVQMGATTKRADILLKNKDKKVVVVEIKRPNIETTEQVQNQLSSYMRILRMDFGLCFGEDLKFFFENPNDKDENIELIFETNFEIDSEDGLKFIELFSKSTFDEEKLYKFCEQKIKEIEAEKQAKENERQVQIEVEKFLANEAKVIRDCFFDFLSEKYPDNIVKILKEQICIKTKEIQSVNYTKTNISEFFKQKFRKITDDEIFGSDNNRNGFQRWLENSGKSSNTVYQYTNAISKISKHFSDNTGKTIDLYKMSNINEILSIATLYDGRGKFAEFGNYGHGTNRAAINAYAKYVSSNDK